MTKALVISALLLGLGGSASAQSLTYGPIIGRGLTPDQMIIKWGTGGSGDATKVSWRKKGDAAFQSVTGGASKDHEIVLTGLTLDTEYEYFAESGSAKTGTFAFTTCPAPGAPMDAVVYGDMRDGATMHKKLVGLIQAKNPEVTISTGDIVGIGNYGTASGPFPTGYLGEFFPAAKDLVAVTPYMAAPGNHDNTSGLANNYGLIFPSPRATGAAWQSYYAYTCGNALFISLDSNKTSDSAQKTFLGAKLAAAAADTTIDHVIIWFHHAPYSVGNHGDNSSVQTNWVPSFDNPNNKVSAVFSGHDHLYGRFNNGSKVAYVVAGAAGAPLYSVSKTSKATAQFTKSTYNFVSLHFAGKLLTGTTYDDSGMQIDTFMVGMASPGGGGGGGGTGGGGGGTGGGGTGGGGTGGGGTGGGGTGGEPTMDPMGAAPSGGCSMTPTAQPSGLALLAFAALLLFRRRYA
jgi:MYXO-CTERM domain-containing protein